MQSRARSICSGKVDVERKSFIFDLQENDRGRYLRITEDVRGRRDIIIIPASGLDGFRSAIAGMIVASAAAGPSPQFPSA
jgi:hypothetical protein